MGQLIPPQTVRPQGVVWGSLGSLNLWVDSVLFEQPRFVRRAENTDLAQRTGEGHTSTRKVLCKSTQTSVKQQFNLATCARRWYRFDTKGAWVPGGIESAGVTKEWADRYCCTLVGLLSRSVKTSSGVRFIRGLLWWENNVQYFAVKLASRWASAK